MGEPEILLPLMVVDTSDIDFATITIGSAQSRSFRIINDGEGELSGELSLIQNSGAFALSSTGSFLIEAMDTLYGELSFTPSSATNFSGQILISSNDPEQPGAAIDLTGAGTELPVPVMSLSISDLNFGTILTTTNTHTQFTLSSTGNDTLAIDSIAVDPTVYQVDLLTPLELAPGETREVNVTFHPTEAGIFNGSLTLFSNSTSSPDVVSLQGAAEEAVSYAATIQPVWDASCGGCHGSNGGLTLTSYANLMAGDSNNGPVVVPGDGANSPIMKRLNGVGGLMPQGGPALSASTITAIETWINQGAHNN